MKTFCYKISFICIGHVYNDGFIIVKINDDQELLSIEGILTYDYIIFKPIDSEMLIRIYSEDYSSNEKCIFLKNTNIPMRLIFDETVKIEDFEIPFHFEFTYIKENLKIVLKIIESMSDVNVYDQILNEYKQFVFGEQI